MPEQRESSVTAPTVERLLEAARRATQHAYVPYSGFPVGAAVLTSDGSVIGGTNIENASYGLTICAERVAVATAAAQGQHEILAVAVSAPRAPFTTPCGACRQVLNEFLPEAGDMTVILDGGPDTDPRLTTLGSLLPNAFGPRNLD